MKSPPQPYRAQLGGTLLGFVVGVVVGLGLALAVAVYVTKVPIPFVDRGVSRSPGQDLIEAERNRGWNPNAALSGRGGSQQPVAPVVVPPADPAGAIVVPPSDGRPLPGTGQPGTATAGDPLGDLVQSRLGQQQPPAAAAPSTEVAAAAASAAGTYFVQAGAFRNPGDAQAQRARLAMLGIDAAVTEREQSGNTVFRVRVGPFMDRALADVTREQLAVNGVDAVLVRVDR